MDFTNQDEDIGMPSSLGYNHPPPISGSAFSKPSPSSSLLSPSPRPGYRNDKVFGDTPTPPPLNPPIHPHPSHYLGKDPDPDAAIPTVPPSPIASASSGRTPATAIESAARYRECLRNHAAAIGGHVVDGCGEFMPSGDVGTPDALKCAACGCHRSFHRREVDGDPNAGSSSYYRGVARLPILLPPPHPLAHHHRPYPLGFPPSPSHAAPGSSSVAVAFGGNTSGSGGTTTESSSEERMNAGAPPPGLASKKRFRTKFTAEQKEKMLAFAESVGWRIHKQDEALVQQVCAEVGVRRQVLKVWMHNNKHTIRRQPQQQPQQEEQQQQHEQQP
ncbi:zinc-finger homeodomain protein 6 [Phoenix dactylifera]|uniref:Zinc-finger homeodomain protein 6 n=1 Tax=Phoenix dactylifera TaxID=42345 RepID=A0A8B9AM91_PHODC|nr:zinc-finger homeodomain protein 6 [Phoenix dactylifera]